MDRRTCLQAGAGALFSAMGAAAFAQAGSKAKAGAAGTHAALPLLRIYIPGGAGGGWDQTGRALGAAIQSAGLAQQVEYENKGGKGGTIGLTDFVERYSHDPAALMVGGMVMVGAIALNQPKITLAQVTPIARLTSDYMVLVVPASSKLKDVKALVGAMQQDLGSVTFTGGSIGGVDHMLAGMMARQLRLDAGALKYEPTSSGKEAMALLASGKAQVAISSYSEFKTDIDNKTLIPLATSSRKSLYGIPSLAERGVSTELANWRGVFGPGLVSEDQKETLRRIVIRATETPAWRQSLLDNSWIGALLYGKEFADALEIEQGIASAVTLMLKLKKS
ncbi:Bug family tripartite tricarboxylate transporter substrate binding protein [Methylibium rhizosphaerae]|uniref:Bug family tripartite tricarboxylate transporter substrate binding protein n=1 Tax=Methylibium rhizosphaerae TaxID=2570323 RepID=UPI001125F961|nr:tripartite tricarboxylate transporter substrate-binding protein [Methylibium rhizosphaerae]